MKCPWRRGSRRPPRHELLTVSEHLPILTKVTLRRALNRPVGERQPRSAHAPHRGDGEPRRRPGVLCLPGLGHRRSNQTVDSAGEVSDGTLYCRRVASCRRPVTDASSGLLRPCGTRVANTVLIHPDGHRYVDPTMATSVTRICEVPSQPDKISCLPTSGVVAAVVTRGLMFRHAESSSGELPLLSLLPHPASVGGGR
jgi:hypothetical protein